MADTCSVDARHLGQRPPHGVGKCRVLWELSKAEQRYEGVLAVIRSRIHVSEAAKVRRCMSGSPPQRPAGGRPKCLLPCRVDCLPRQQLGEDRRVSEVGVESVRAVTCPSFVPRSPRSSSQVTLCLEGALPPYARCVYSIGFNLVVQQWGWHLLRSGPSGTGRVLAQSRAPASASCSTERWSLVNETMSAILPARSLVAKFGSAIWVRPTATMSNS